MTTLFPSAVPSSVEDLYQQYLGRASDPTGLAYWQQQFGSSIDPNEVKQFLTAAQPELAQRGMTPPIDYGVGTGPVTVVSTGGGKGRYPEMPPPTYPGQEPPGFYDVGGPGYYDNTPPPVDYGVGTGPVTVVSTGGGKGRMPEMPPPVEESISGYEPWLPGGGGKPTPGFEGDRTRPMYIDENIRPSGYGLPPSQFIPKSVEDLYREYLGRASDPTGLAYWQQQFGSEIDPKEILQFLYAAQPEMRQRGLPTQIAPLSREMMRKAIIS